jgi:hypothetical protein
LIRNIQDCWDDFRSKVTEELDHDAWTTSIQRQGGPKKGIPWFDNSIRPEKCELIVVTIQDEEILRVDLEEYPPIPERMVRHLGDKVIDNRPDGLVDLGEAMEIMTLPPN